MLDGSRALSQLLYIQIFLFFSSRFEGFDGSDNLDGLGCFEGFDAATVSGQSLPGSFTPSPTFLESSALARLAGMSVVRFCSSSLFLWLVCFEQLDGLSAFANAELSVL